MFDRSTRLRRKIRPFLSLALLVLYALTLLVMAILCKGQRAQRSARATIRNLHLLPAVWLLSASAGSCFICIYMYIIRYYIYNNHYFFYNYN